MLKIEQLLTEYRVWALARSTMLDREGSYDEPSSDEFADSDDEAVALLHRAMKAVRVLHNGLMGTP